MSCHTYDVVKPWPTYLTRFKYVRPRLSKKDDNIGLLYIRVVFTICTNLGDCNSFSRQNEGLYLFDRLCYYLSFEFGLLIVKLNR